MLLTKLIRSMHSSRPPPAAVALDRVRFVVATREPTERFLTHTATGRSLALYRVPASDILLAADNREGLATVYNAAIEAAKADPAILVFLHDDVHLLDFHWAQRIREALDVFQIIGLAGNTNRSPRQASWVHLNDSFAWDKREHLSGIVGLGTAFPPRNVSNFGPTGRRVRLLDGLLLAAHSKTLNDHQLRFDEQFSFHFYDMDFCRQAEVLGLTMGTFAMSVVHESGGNFKSDAWSDAYRRYIAKWKD
jgi:GT2 family glycosyltransferase